MLNEERFGVSRDELQLTINPTISPIQYDPGSDQIVVAPVGANGSIILNEVEPPPTFSTTRQQIKIDIDESRPDDTDEYEILNSIYELIESGDLQTAVNSKTIPIRQEIVSSKFPFSRNFDLSSVRDPTSIWRVTAGLVEKK